jgi:hypothetical protein
MVRPRCSITLALAGKPDFHRVQVSFSQRMGILPVVPPLQREVIAGGTRVRLWNVLHMKYWENRGDNSFRYSTLYPLFTRYWHHFFEWRLDQMPSQVPDAIEAVDSVYRTMPWHRLLDFLEFTAENGPDERAQSFRAMVNLVFEEDNSAYRFVGTEILEITSPVEISGIESALNSVSKLNGPREHIEAALRLLSDRTNPDYRNSMKESISAVESVAQLLCGKPDAKLSAALAVIESKGGLHGALKSGFASLYGYTSDADGIRHALQDEATVTFTDAKYMLVSCSAFVSYLLAKAADLKLTINS